MRTATTSVIYAFVFAALTFAIGFLISELHAKYADASVGWGNEYNANLVTSATASGTAMTIYKTGPGSIGSLVIASSSPVVATYPIITIYDASSTMATSSARKIVQFTGTPTVGTYTFDAVVTNGVAIEVPVGFNGAYTITWR